MRLCSLKLNTFSAKESGQINLKPVPRTGCHANVPLKGLESIQLRKQKTTCEVFQLVKFSRSMLLSHPLRLKRRISYRPSSLWLQQF